MDLHQDIYSLMVIRSKLGLVLIWKIPTYSFGYIMAIVYLHLDEQSWEHKFLHIVNEQFSPGKNTFWSKNI